MIKKMKRPSLPDQGLSRASTSALSRMILSHAEEYVESNAALTASSWLAKLASMTAWLSSKMAVELS